ncbi:hypothetical protein TSOC_011494 [Tetrabaena socialis]|uniref:Uncharacterized protein n=1 Tax=Tetrabaena socialis TaxID=47790 RepID=A0A2J7ZQI8_9CHLO|nr:hypothetical protein TSOC_011494 [Tetrabaena socialis]|eukprot:PNH02520.1 hypothetical protein TSOC_011494 [Tetrabaena socialis]
MAGPAGAGAGGQQQPHVLALTLAAAFLAPPRQQALQARGPQEQEEQGEQPGGRAGGEDGARGVGGGGGGGVGPLRGVVPCTLAEAGEALAAQRRHEALLAALRDAEAGRGMHGESSGGVGGGGAELFTG